MDGALAHVLATVLLAVSYASVGVFAAALVACAVRRWRLAATLSRAVSLAGLGVFVVTLATLMALPAVARAPTIDPAAKATLLSQGVSEIMNCGVLAYLAAIPGALVWAIARWRLRAGGVR